MSILFSGDFHGNAARELESITKKSLMEKYRQEKYNAIRYHIILGDGGFLWPGERKTDIYNFKVLAYRPFPVLCVIGNHEPVLGISGLPEVDIGIGQMVCQIQAEPFVAYLKRGKSYIIDGFRILVRRSLLRFNTAPLGRFILGVRGICSPVYAKLSKMNLQYPAALRQGFFIYAYDSQRWDAVHQLWRWHD